MRDLQTEFSSLRVSPETEPTIGPSGFKAEGRVQPKLSPSGGGLKRCKFSLNSNILDIGVLAERCMDDWELVREVVLSFSDQCEASLRSLEAALTRSDVDQIAFDLDFLQGASINVGALDLNIAIQNLADGLEESSRGQPESNNREDSMEQDVDDESSPSPIDCDLPPTTASPSALSQGLESPNRTKSTAKRKMSRDSSFSKSAINLLRNQQLKSHVWRDHFECVQLHFRAAVAYWTQLTHQAGLNYESEEEESAENNERLKDFLASQASTASSGHSSTEDANFMEDSLTSPNVDKFHHTLKDEFAGADWADPDTVAAFFRQAVNQVLLIRRYMSEGARNDIRIVAKDLHELSVKAGLMQIGRKAEILENLVPSDLRQSHIDSLEQQVDASIAIWDRCRLKI